MNSRFLVGLAGCCFVCANVFATSVKVPYSGRLAQNGTLVNGNAQFKFVLINPANGQSVWSNDNTSTNGGAPTSAVTINVSNGLYSVLLGDTSLSNMTTLDSSVFNTTGLKLRVFVNGEQLAPDVELGTSPYAANANSLNGIDSSALLQLSGGTMTGALTVNGNVSLGTDAGNNTITLGNNPNDTVTINGTINGASPFVLEGATANANKLTLSLADPTAPRTILFPDASGTVALTSNNLSSFAATTSAQLRNVISDETGNGSLVFSDGPTLTFTNLANGVTITPLAVITVLDLNNSHTSDALILNHATSGTPANGIGVDMLFQNSNSAGSLRLTGGISSNLTNVTSGSETGELIFQTGVGGTLANRMTITVGTIDALTNDITTSGDIHGGNITAPGLISTTGSGTITSAGGFTGNGSGLTNLNGSNVATGTIADSRIGMTGAIFSGHINSLHTSGEDFGAVSGISNASTTESSVASVSPNRAVTAQNMIVKIDVAPGGATQRHFGLRVNGFDLGFGCNIQGASTTCNSGALSEPIPAGATISIVDLSQNGATAAANAQFAFEVR